MTVPVSEARSNRIAALTGVRFFAALLVFFGHAGWLVLDPNQYPLTGSAIARQRETGVGLFFALSGFVIAFTYGRQLIDDPKRSGGYLWRRFARLYPMYLLAIVVVGVPLGLYLGNAGDVSALVEQVFAVNSWSGDPTAWFGWHGGVWSVSTEACFYVGFPVLALLVLRRITRPATAIKVWVAVWVATCAWWLLLIHRGEVGGGYWLFVFPPTRFLEFCLGALTGWAFVRSGGRALPRGVGWCGFTGLLAALFTVGGADTHSSFYPLVFLPLFSITLYWLASESTAVSRALSHRRLVLLGDASYSFYLVHVVGFFAARWGWHLLSGNGQEAGGLFLWWGVAFAFVLATALSIACFKLVERPAQGVLMSPAVTSPGWVEQLLRLLNHRHEGHQRNGSISGAERAS